MEKTYTIPDWFRHVCYAGVVFMLCMGIYMIYMEFTQIKGKNIIFMGLAFFFLAWSMFVYTRLKLTLGPQEISYTGGLRPHHLHWNDITSVDMLRSGRYREVVMVIRYGNRRLRLERNFFRKEPFLEILNTVERYSPPGVFTTRYHQIKTEILS